MTPGLGNRCSIQLSYGDIAFRINNVVNELFCATLVCHPTCRSAAELVPLAPAYSRSDSTVEFGCGIFLLVAVTWLYRSGVMVIEGAGNRRQFAAILDTPV